jgi:hypothetical protein
MYEYLIVYRFEADGFITPCEATIELFRKKKIKSFNDIKDIKEYLTERSSKDFQGVKNLSIYNIMYIGRNRH